MEARIAQLEAGDGEVGTIPSLGPLSDEHAMYAYIVENSRLLGTENLTPTPSPPEPIESDSGIDPFASEHSDAESVPPPVELVLQNQVWA